MADGTRIPTNLRTLLILEILGKSDRAMTATEINEGLGLPKQTIHRLCATLEENGFLTHYGSDRRYQVSRRLRELGTGLLYNSRDHIEIHQILQEVSHEVEETVNFVRPGDNGMKYIDRVETDWAFRIQLPIGTHVPFHCTASGKCFLSSLAPDARNRFVTSLKLISMTEKTMTDPEPLLAELETIRVNGYSLDREEFLDGMVAIAVPVTDPAGRFIAAIAVHAPKVRMSLDAALGRKELLQGAAIRLRDTLFPTA